MFISVSRIMQHTSFATTGIKRGGRWLQSVSEYQYPCASCCLGWPGWLVWAGSDQNCMINIRPQRPGAFSKLLLYKDMIYVISTLKEIQCQTYLRRPACAVWLPRPLVSFQKIKSFIKTSFEQIYIFKYAYRKSFISQALH